MFQVLKQNNYQSRLLYPAKEFFKLKGEIKTFHNKYKLKFMTTKSALLKILKGIPHTEEEERYTQA
jgi:hypothetical protein